MLYSTTPIHNQLHNIIITVLVHKCVCSSRVMYESRFPPGAYEPVAVARNDHEGLNLGAPRCRRTQDAAGALRRAFAGARVASPPDRSCGPGPIEVRSCRRTHIAVYSGYAGRRTVVNSPACGVCVCADSLVPRRGESVSRYSQCVWRSRPHAEMRLLSLLPWHQPACVRVPTIRHEQHAWRR